MVVLVMEADWLGEWERLLCNIGAAEFNLTEHGELCACVCVCVGGGGVHVQEIYM